MPAGKPTRSLPVREGYDLWSATYDSTPNPVVAMDARHSIALLRPQPGERILDAGCGTGRNLEVLASAGASPFGLDFSAGMLSVARRRAPGVPVLQADLQQPLPFRNATFDAVLCALIGEHLPRLDLTFREFHRVLKPGARLVFTVYHPALAFAGVEANFDHDGVEHRLGAVLYRPEDYRNLAAAAGFADVESRDIHGDSELARQIPKASGLLGRPVLFALTATRSR